MEMGEYVTSYFAYALLYLDRIQMLSEVKTFS